MAFCEASGDRLVRTTGTDPKLVEEAKKAALDVGCGHTFWIFLQPPVYPLHVLRSVKDCNLVVRIFCATANPLQVIVAETEQGRGVMGVVDGGSPLGVENEDQAAERRNFLRAIGYKQ